MLKFGNKITTDQFITMVREEINHIKIHATKDEIINLKMKHFAADSYTHCIYGLMTGHCENRRARELYPKSHDKLGVKSDHCSIFYMGIEEGSGLKIKKPVMLTPLESFLFHTSSRQHKMIFKYLKGKSDKLDLKIDQFNYGTIHEIPADALLH